MGFQLRGILIALVISLPVASYFWVFKPLNNQINKEKAETEHREALLTKLQEETANNEDLERANQDIQSSIRLIEARLPSNKEVDAVVRQVSNLAVDSNLSAPAMRSSKPVQSSVYMEQPIEMETSGNFIDFFTFLAKVEKLPRIMRIHDLKIEGLAREARADGIAKDAELKATFTLSIYFQDEKQRVAQGDTK
jgi:type IV pilus assembly protein PilO